MLKKGITASDIFVNKLSEKKGKILRREELMRLWLLAGGSKSRFSYGLTCAKNRKVVTPFGTRLFLVGEIAFMEDVYWELVSVLIHELSPAGAIIAHEKSMELHLRNYEIPTRLILYTRDIAKRIVIGKYEFHFRTLKSGQKTHIKNLFQILRDDMTHISVQGVLLPCLSLEASLLDVASLRIHGDGMEEALLLRFLDRFSSKISRQRLGFLIRFRYIRAINRIRALAKTHGFNDLYNIALEIIKDEGGTCFLHL